MAKIKILVTSFDYRPRLGGIATCAYNLCKSLSKCADVEVRLIAPSISSGRHYEDSTEFSVIRTAFPNQAILAVPLLAAQIRKQVKLWNPHLVFHMVWYPDAIASWLLKLCFLNRRFPYFVLTHGKEVLESSRTFLKIFRRVFSWVKKRTLQNAAHIFSVSHFTRRLVIHECVVSGSRVTTVFNGVDLEKFHPDRKLIDAYPPQEPLQLLTVCRIEHYKGIDVVLDALAELKKRGRRFHYRVVGRGPDLARIKQKSLDLEVSSQVEFFEDVDDSELVKFYQRCDLLIQLTRTDYSSPDMEGFGLVFLEAAACERPAIGGRSGGIPDAIEDGITGWLTDPTAPRELILLLEELTLKPERIRETGIAAHQRARDRFSWQRMALEILNEIKNHVRH